MTLYHPLYTNLFLSKPPGTPDNGFVEEDERIYNACMLAWGVDIIAFVIIAGELLYSLETTNLGILDIMHNCKKTMGGVYVLLAIKWLILVLFFAGKWILIDCII